MAAEVQSTILATPMLCSRLVLPEHHLRLFALMEEYDGLWDCVNRICDQYMPKLFDSSGQC